MASPVLVSAAAVRHSLRLVTAPPHMHPMPDKSFHPHSRFLFSGTVRHPFSTPARSRATIEVPLCARRDRSEATCHFLEEFSLLPQDIPCKDVDVWATMALYFFSLHVPLSFGGLSIISEVLQQPKLDPLTEVVSVLLLQITELMVASTFFSFTKIWQHVLSSIFQIQVTSKNRNWIKGSLVGLGVLFIIVLFTSFLADLLSGPKDVKDLELLNILQSSPAAKTMCIFVYCFVTPLLEEMVYRGFLLTSLASTLKWQQAVMISALTFSLSHLSLENAPQLFVVGTVLGCVYCWTGNLLSSVVVHSAYNAAILVITGLT